jgi:hypothetical protein
MKQIPLVIFFATGLITSSATFAATVSADGKNWRQLTETGGLSFNTITTLCPIGGGACSGAYDGWTWATVSEVQSLFQTYNATFVANGGVSTVGAVGNNNPWAPSFLADFNKTQGTTGTYENVAGWTATASDSTWAFIGEVSDSFLVSASYPDLMRTITSTRTGSIPGRGVWLYETSPVPLPAAAWLFISALGGLVVAKRKQLKA